MLLLDVGNSRVKWARVEDGAWTHRGAVEVPGWDALGRALASVAPPHRIIASNVAGRTARDAVRTACGAWPVEVEFVAARAHQCGVRNSYDEPEKLGSDRWAALIAAWHMEHAATLVVNSGTATTVDALSAQGEFLGGLILPGLDMMRRSLAAGTAQLEVAAGAVREFPRNTADAMASGAILATAGAICRQHARLRDPFARCLLSGGAADIVEAHLDMPLLRVDDLVLRGLYIIGQEEGAL